MKFALVLLAACVSTGCTVNMRLLEDGKVHQGTFSPASRTLTAVIDGDSYSGPASQGVGLGVGQTFYGGKVGFGTTTVATGQWQGLLTNKSGKVIRCQFQAAMGSGQGLCQDNNGRSFDLVIGSMPGDAPSVASKQCNHGVFANGRCGG
jgi:hypothetical protein